MPRVRLTTEAETEPWVRAGTLPEAFLYWLPVSGYPSRHVERAWLRQFLGLLGERLGQVGLQAETFLQMSTISEHLGEGYLRGTQGTPKRTGLGRTPGTPVPAAPNLQEAQDAATSGKPLDLKSWFAAYVKWIHTTDHDRLRELFLGYGGLLTLFLPPDPKAAPPPFHITPKLRRAMPVFGRMDVDGLVRSTFAVRHSWLAKSKALYGEGLEDRTEYPGIPFVLPLLAAQDILGATPEWRADLFSLFPVMVRESEADRGVLLLFQDPAYESLLLEVLQQLEADGQVYPGTQPHEARA